MSVTATEATAVVLEKGDTVRVSDAARNGSGDTSGPVRGKIAKLEFFESFDGWFVKPNDGTPGRYVLPQYLTKLTEANILAAEVAKLAAELAAARTEASNFTDNVRDALSDAAGDDSDLYDPLNAILSVLGLELLERDFEVTVRFEGSYTTTVTATSEDDARETIGTSEIAAYLGENPYAGNIDDYSTEAE